MEAKQALLLAVSAAVEKRIAKGANKWALVGEVMRHLTGETGDWRKRWQRAKAHCKTEAALEATIAAVDPGSYMDTVEHVVKNGAAPGGSPLAIPGVNTKAPLTAEERVAEHKLRLQANHDRAVAQKLINQQAMTDLLVDAVLTGAQTAPPVEWRPAPTVIISPDAGEEVPVALLSDIHIGTLVDPEEMGGLGEYNFDILKRRLNRYQERILEIIDLHRRAARIKKMLVYMLGDMVEGEVIFDGQAHRIEMITVDQLFEGSSYIMGWLQGILASGLVEEIHVAGIYGNHGRTTHRKGASKAHSNWDYVMYKHMEKVLERESRIKWFIPKAWFALVDVLGTRIYGTHGDTIKSWMGIPFYGIQRHDARTTLLLQSVGLTYDGMVYGDKHITATLPRVEGWQIMNGSTVGGSDFSMHQLSTASQPMQTIFGIHDRHGKTWQYDVVLEKRDPDLLRQHLAFTSV